MMKMATSKSLYQQVIVISAEYLGPSAERFISRQVANHLRKDPAKLTKRDIPELTKWVKITFSLLTNDQELVEAFVQDLESLAASSPRTTGVIDAQTK